MSALVTHFGEHAEYTGASAGDRDAWLALRDTMLTASDVAAILGEDDKRSALSVYVDKITERSEPEQIGLDDPRFWGNVLEQPILRAVAEHYGWTYHAGGALLRSREHPDLGATLDAEIYRGGPTWEVLEGKTTRVPRGWSEDDGELPTRVLIQVQTQLLVTGAPLAIVFALLQGSRPVQIEVHPSPEFHKVIAEEAERFMTRVRETHPPPPDHTESSRKALMRLHPRDSGVGTLLPDAALEWTREIKAINEQAKDLEKRKAELQNLLRAAIGSATYGLLPTAMPDAQCAWKLGLEERPEHIVAASSSRVLRAIKKVPAIPIVSNLAPGLANADRAVDDLLRRTLELAEKPIEELIEASSVGETPRIAAHSRKRRRARR